MENTNPNQPDAPAKVEFATVVVTHSGPFHADDAFAVAVLATVIPNAKVIRTRDPETIEGADVVVDVGGEYDLARRRFDHHQRGGAGARWDTDVPYAAFGLVWSHYGPKAVATILAEAGVEAPADQRAMVERIVGSVDGDLVSAVDGVDTGHVPYAGFSVSSVIGGMNPRWFEAQDFDAAFDRAVVVAGGILRDTILDSYGEALAEDVVDEAVKAAGQGAEVVVLPRFCPWQKRVAAAAAKLVVYPTIDCRWNVQVVAEEERGGRKSRILLPEAWGGLAGAVLRARCGVDDAVFCHGGRFICGALSKDGALRLAELALEAAR